MIRAAARRVIGPSLRFTLGTELNQLRALGPGRFVRWNAVLADAWIRDRVNRRRYTLVDDAGLRAARKSDTVFIFGSGYSLNELTPAEWDFFRQHDVFGFNAFYFQKWVPVDFHLLRVGIYGDLRWQPYAREVSDVLNGNPNFVRTIFILQDKYLAHFTNQLVGYRLLPAGARIFRYTDARQDGPPTRSFREGLRHTSGTLADAVNCAYCAGWTTIVLVGVDLYDSRYFYLDPDETVGFDDTTGRPTPAERNYWRGQRYDEPHNTVRAGVVSVMREWRDAIERDGVRLLVYNPRSLLAEVLPVYRRSGARADAAPKEEHHA